MVAGFLAAGVSNITMAVGLKPISEDLGWSRTLTAAAITLGALYWVDRGKLLEIICTDNDFKSLLE